MLTIEDAGRVPVPVAASTAGSACRKSHSMVSPSDLWPSSRVSWNTLAAHMAGILILRPLPSTFLCLSFVEDLLGGGFLGLCNCPDTAFASVGTITTSVAAIIGIARVASTVAPEVRPIIVSDIACSESGACPVIVPSSASRVTLSDVASAVRPIISLSIRC